MKHFLIIFKDKVKSGYRIDRVVTEIKNAGHDVDLVCSVGMKITAAGFLVDNKILNLAKYDIVFSIGNGELQHQLATVISCYTKSVFWPDKEALFYDDKFNEAVFMESIGVPKPKTILLTSTKSKDIDDLIKEVEGYPCIIKKAMGSGGEFVELANSSSDVLDFLDKVPHPSISGKRNIILQEYIKESKGTDFRVFCVGEKVLGTIKRTSRNGGFKANVSLGGKAEKVEISKEMKAYAKKIMKESKLLIAGIDFIKSNRGYLVLEINISPGIEGFEKATGVNVAKKIVLGLLERTQQK